MKTKMVGSKDLSIIKGSEMMGRENLKFLHLIASLISRKC